MKYIKLLPEDVDAVEVWNAGNRDELFNQRALWYAESFGLPQTAGSDAHRPEAFGGGILTEADIRQTEDFPAVIREGGIRGLITGL